MEIQNKGTLFKFNNLKAYDGAPVGFDIVAKDEKEARANLIKSFEGFIKQLKEESV